MSQPALRPPRIAAIQAASVFLDREATIEKACALIAEAGRRGVQLALFPEAYVPGYPDWVWVVPSGKKKLLNPLYSELVNNAVTIPGPSTDRLCAAARQAGVIVAIGVSERNAEGSNASLYNTLLYIDADGTILGKHRKLVPTGGERLVWARGDGDTLSTYKTGIGTIGGLICWENYMPLARYALYCWGTQIYLAPTWDHGETWISTLRHIAKEGRVYIVGSCTVLKKDDIPDRFEFRSLYDQSKEWINPGESVIVGPEGTIIAGPAIKKEEILVADVDCTALEGTKWILDVSGHYARPDVFDLRVNRTAHPLVRSIVGKPLIGKKIQPATTRAKKPTRRRD